MLYENSYLKLIDLLYMDVFTFTILISCCLLCNTMIFRLNFTPGDKRTCPEKGMRLPVASPLQSVHQLAVACMCVLYVGGELYAQFSPHTCVRSYSTVSYNYCCCLWCLRQLSSRYQYRYIPWYTRCQQSKLNTTTS